MNFVATLCIVILTLFASSSAIGFQIPSVENADGSYSIGHVSDSQGETPASVAALLSFAQGWTTATRNEQNEKDAQQGNEVDKPVKKTDDLSPTAEFFKLLEALVTLKVQLISRAYQIFSDNSWLFRGIYNVFLSNLDTVHRFTLTGIVVLRRIFEFATYVLETWKIPSLSTKLQWASQGFQALVGTAIQNQQNNNNNNQNTDYYDPTYDNNGGQRFFNNNNYNNNY